VEWLIARNPDPDSRLPYLLRLPLEPRAALRRQRAQMTHQTVRRVDSVQQLSGVRLGAGDRPRPRVVACHERERSARLQHVEMKPAG